MRRHTAIPLFKVLGVPQRLVVFQRVARRPSTASALAKELPISRSAVVQHLGTLRQHGLVEARSEGRNRIYRAMPYGLAPLREWLETYGK
jgi:DNA-binding transcriptional ArsR family regulator